LRTVKTVCIRQNSTDVSDKLPLWKESYFLMMIGGMLLSIFVAFDPTKIRQYFPLFQNRTILLVHVFLLTRLNACRGIAYSSRSVAPTNYGQSPGVQFLLGFRSVLPIVFECGNRFSMQFAFGIIYCGDCWRY
jgi:hypothetical protein